MGSQTVSEYNFIVVCSCLFIFFDEVKNIHVIDSDIVSSILSFSFIRFITGSNVIQV
jgi:hypothetical protein